MKKSQDDKIFSDFEEKTNDIIVKMFQALVKAQRKIEDVKYREILKKINS